jgi:hypothetical protein
VLNIVETFVGNLVGERDGDFVLVFVGNFV